MPGRRRAAPRDGQAFQRWFANSKGVDDDGRPLQPNIVPAYMSLQTPRVVELRTAAFNTSPSRLTAPRRASRRAKAKGHDAIIETAWTAATSSTWRCCFRTGVSRRGQRRSLPDHVLDSLRDVGRMRWNPHELHVHDSALCVKVDLDNNHGMDQRR